VSWFRSRYVQFLEGELAHCRKRHAEEMETLKKNHAEELSRAINEANRGWAEADRLRQYVVPGLPASTRETPESTPPVKVSEEIEHGATPFQRYAAKDFENQKKEALERERRKKEAAQFPTPTAPPAQPA
jgi:hypothetical protein